jgi:hypothetical protein
MTLPSDDLSDDINADLPEPTATGEAPLVVRLHERDPELSALCREIETRIAEGNINPRAECCDIDVHHVREFAAHPALKGRAAYTSQPAVHVRPQQSGERPLVLVNGPVFADETAVAQRAILAHEVAHGVRALAGPSLPLVQEEFEADCLACQWGFDEELLASRAEDYGREYVETLSRLIKAKDAVTAWGNQYQFKKIRAKRQIT